MLFFDLLTTYQQRKACKFGTSTAYSMRSLIIRQGEQANGIHVIREGTIESVYYTESDRELCLATWGKHDFVGAPHIFGNAYQQWSARALTDVEVLHLNQNQLRGLINHFPDIAVSLIQSLGYKGERYSELAQRLAFYSVSQRLAITLLETWEEAQRCQPGLYSLPVPSRLELSRVIGSTRQAVGHAMRSLCSNGLLTIEQGHFSLPHIERLKDIAGHRRYETEHH